MKYNNLLNAFFSSSYKLTNKIKTNKQNENKSFIGGQTGEATVSMIILRY